MNLYLRPGNYLGIFFRDHKLVSGEIVINEKKMKNNEAKQQN